MLPGMQALHTLVHFWLAAVLHGLPVAELCALCRNGSGAPATSGGALVVGTVKVPLPAGVPTLQWWQGP